MERRSRALYDAVFLHILRSFPNFVKGTIVTDYEVALIESLKHTFPEALLKGCFFHYCQV